MIILSKYQTATICIILLLFITFPQLSNIKNKISKSDSQTLPDGLGEESKGSSDIPGEQFLNFIQTNRKAAISRGESQLNATIQSLMDTHNIPGLSACIVADNKIVWSGEYGLADMDLEIDVADSTLFMIASISKTVVAVAAMQLWEDGALDLDANINDYLPFDVVNPFYSEIAITTRMLLSHTSSLARNDQVWFTKVTWTGDSPIPIGEFLEDYLVPGGQYYSPVNYLPNLPGSTPQYCNYAFALIAHIVENISGKTFEQYCQNNIFAPLEMDETSWFLANLDEDNIAVPYDWTGFLHTSYNHYGVIIYPCGQLRTSVPQLAQHLISFMSYDKVFENTVLDSATIELMRTVQFPEVTFPENLEVGLGWMKLTIDDSTILLGHDGVMWGYQSAMYFDPVNNTGFIALINLFESGDPGFNNILQELMEFSFDYDNDGIIAGLDNCLEFPNPDQADSDADGYADACDNCPEDHNPEQEDFDGDSTGDTCDGCPDDYNPIHTDIDMDGVEDVCDNCLEHYNPGQEDGNGNDVGDVCDYVCGDADGLQPVNILDIVYLINFKYKGGPSPEPLEAADVNSDLLVNILDIVYLINYKYKSGPEPQCVV